MGIKSDVIVSAVFCGVLIVYVGLMRLVNSPYIFAKSCQATVDFAILAALNPTFSPLLPNSMANMATLQYHLTVNISVPSIGQNIWFRDFSAIALYNNSMLGVPENWIPTNKDPPGRPTDLPPPQGEAWPSPSIFQGAVVVYPSVAAELERERAEGTVRARVRVSLTATVPMKYSSNFIFNNYDCWLWFPPPGDGAPAVFGQGTRCSLVN